MNDTRITEVFSSIQGEGIFVGEPQVFVRLAKCNLDCDFCDTPKKGGRQYSDFELIELITSLAASNAASVVAVTGGEPLLYPDFLRRLLPQLKKRNFKIYLETNGTLPGNLKKILDHVDVVAMDMKLPGAQKGKRSFWTEHRDFLGLAKEKKAFVKIVVTVNTTPEEIKKAAAIINDIDPRIPLVLQAVTPGRRIKKKAPLKKLLEFQRLAKVVLDDVRIIPQVHRLIGAR
ncbi:MAG: 7-carboxy-7-deazaguanine synthase QueE [Candidatus Omnitrophica bacterium]|nr:7-carboxy-7-deazaguanine synthase QueE [Candidatus Omnitrophota bacterium]